MLYLTCTIISSVDLAYNEISRAKDIGICAFVVQICLEIHMNQITLLYMLTS